LTIEEPPFFGSSAENCIDKFVECSLYEAIPQFLANLYPYRDHSKSKDHEPSTTRREWAGLLSFCRYSIVTPLARYEICCPDELTAFLLMGIADSIPVESYKNYPSMMNMFLFRIYRDFH
jgi:hypothetical protein